MEVPVQINIGTLIKEKELNWYLLDYSEHYPSLNPGIIG